MAMAMGEREWVILVQTCIEEEIEEEDKKTPVSIFSVPETLRSSKPEAYVPQIFAFGPYHHWLPKLYDMERHKFAAARRTITSRLPQGTKIQDLVQQLMKREHKIRSYYQRNINHSMETIAWMMIVDASFLLEFLQNYTEKNREMMRKKLTSATPPRRADHERMKMGYNMVLRDIVMLENQIPLYVLRKLKKFLGPPVESADSELSEMLAGFADEVSPFKTTMMDADQSVDDDIVRHAHLLELLYYTIVPKQKELVVEDLIEDIDVEEEEDNEAEPKEVELGDTSHVERVYNWFKNLAPSLGGPLVSSLKRVIVSGPVRLLVKLPWKVVTTLPIFSVVKQPVESYFSNMKKGDESGKEDQSGHIDRPPLVEEIAVPSVTDLVNAGVNFKPTAGGDITSIVFDTKTVTMYLPVVTLDVNTEVVLRNLVAYEASVVSGPLVFTRYTELMNGIVDTEEDVKVLCGKGVVVNRMKNDGEAAALWNGMSKSVRLSKVGFLDKVIRDVNKYYRSRWRVKSKEFMKKYVFGSWQVLTFLAAALLLFLSCVQAFCSVYSCNSHLTRITSVGAPPGTG